jgi:hypothetical protein
MRYQALSGGGAPLAASPARRLAPTPGSMGAAPPQDGARAGFGLPVGIAALSPFVALLGKAIKDRSGER